MEAGRSGRRCAEVQVGGEGSAESESGAYGAAACSGGLLRTERDHSVFLSSGFVEEEVTRCDIFAVSIWAAKIFAT